MKKTLLTALVSLAALGATAQVQNHALSFTSAEGVANLGRVEQLADQESYTLQLWFSPSKWIQGVSVLRCGKFSIKLGVDHAIVVNDGTNHLTATTSQIGAGKWTQLTLRTSASSTSLTVNNAQTFTCDKPLALPADESSLWLGGDYEGRIDEVRLWQGTLSDEFESFWRNTLNEFCPSWSSLLAYWKLDQEQCANIVDYTGLHHGTMSATGVSKIPVADNAAMPYLVNLAYGDITRYFDRAIDPEHYRLSNRIAIIAGHYNQYTKSAHLLMEREDATVPATAQHLDQYQGRQGVMHLTGDGLTLPSTVLRHGSKDTENPAAPAAYTFEAWIYNNSTSDATLLSKGDVTITLKADGKIAVGDKTSTLAVPASQWVHVGVSISGTSALVKVGNSSATLALGSTFTPGISDAQPIVGQGFNGYLDDVMLIAKARSEGEMTNDANHVPIGDDKFKVSGPGTLVHLLHGCYQFDRQDCPGYDSFSIDHCYATMRSHTEGYRGVKYLLSLAANNFAQGLSDANVRASLGKTMADMGNDPMYDGLDLDFEWPQNANEWNNVALLCQVIRQHLDAGKELTVSPHAKYYSYPTARMADIDFFNFQIYGPNDINLFTQSRFPGYANNFINHGYPTEQIVMSYATTTNGGSNEAGTRVASSHPGYYPNGYVSLGNVPKDATKVYHAGNDCWYYLTAYNQTYWRANYCVANGLRGIMYWDMGNDVPASNPLSLAIAASLGLNSNVERLVTAVDAAACAPADDPYAPIATPDPDDQGGFDPEASKQAIEAALNAWAHWPGYATSSAPERHALLLAINQAKLGVIDGDALNAAVAAYQATTPSDVSGPQNGKKYYIVGVNSNDQTQRSLYFDGTDLKCSAQLLTGDQYQWTATVNADSTFTLTQGGNTLLGQALAVVPGNKPGRLQLCTSPTNYLNSYYTTANTTADGITVAAGNNVDQDASNPKRWSSQWELREVEPELPGLYTVSVSHSEGGLLLADNCVATHGQTVYHHPEVTLGAQPTGHTQRSLAIDHQALTIDVNYGGMHTSKLYRLANANYSANQYLTLTNGRMMEIQAADEANASQLFAIEANGNGQFAIAVQGMHVGATSDNKDTQIGASAQAVNYHVVHRAADDAVAFDRTMANGGTWTGGSRALSVPSGNQVKTWGTGTTYSWWTPEEVTSFNIPTVSDGTTTYGAVCLPFAFTTSGQTYTAAVENGVAKLQVIEQPVAAQTPVIVVGASTVNPLVGKGTSAVSDLKGSLLAGTTPALTLALSNGTPAFVPSTTTPANSAWLAGDSVTTIAAPEQTSATVVNATDDTAVYDLQGRRVAHPASGLYITSGRKVFKR